MAIKDSKMFNLSHKLVFNKNSVFGWDWWRSPVILLLGSWEA
jgi:hypothetical protein